METLSDSKLAQIDWAMLSTYVLSSTWSLNTMETVKEILHFIVEDEETPNTERLLKWFPNTVVQHNGPHYLTLGATRRGTSLFSIQIENKTNNLVQSYVTYYELNDLRSKCIHFPYCYLYVKATPPIIDDDVSLTWMIKSEEKENINHLLLEHIKGERLTIYLRQQTGNLKNYASIFLQTLLAMQYAYNKTSLVHGDLIISHIIVEENPIPDLWIPIGDYYIRGNKISRIVDIFCSCTKRRRKTPLYDIYKFSITYLYELTCHRSIMTDSMTFLNILVQFLQEIHIPIALITCARTLTKAAEEIANESLPKNINITTTYENAIRIFLRLCGEKMNIDDIYCTTLNEEKKCMDLKSPFLIPYRPHPLDGYIYAVAEDLRIEDMEKGESIKDYNEKSITNLMGNIDKTYHDIHKGFRDIRSISLERAFSLPPHDLKIHINKILFLFYDFLSVRILLDDLRSKLKYREILYLNDLRNCNISNYIRENDAKLLRLMGENIDLYDQCSRIVDHSTLKTIQQIMKILNNPSLSTRQ